MDNYIIREIEYTDFNNGYLELLYQFNNYKYKITELEFINYLEQNKVHHNCKIYVIELKLTNNDNNYNHKKIIGAGTIFKLEKLHNNIVGLIEDVIIDNNYRGSGLGKLLIDKLTNIGLVEFGCYKVILDCSEKNIEFYKKCNFFQSGAQMRNIVT
jgi:glucosamine-phosphate N-acetyltransferase